jgi:hypothetical protein
MTDHRMFWQQKHGAETAHPSRVSPGGFECENYYIFFMECPLYNNIRRNLLVILRVYDEIDLNVIVYGNTECSINQNKDIFRAVQVY